MPPPPRRHRKKTDWFTRLSDWKVEDLFRRKAPPPRPRTIYVNEDLPPEAFDPKGRPHKDWVFPTNQVVTSKYTIFTFLPKNLLEQFRRIANM